MQEPMVSMIVEVPESLYWALQEFTDTHSNWSQGRMLSAALALFLMQNGGGNQIVNRIYLDTLFDFAA